MKRLFLAAFVTIIAACGDEKKAAVEANVGLGGEVAAKVGSQVIPLSIVTSVANAQKISARDAARRLVDDEVAAEGARSRGLDQRTPVSWKLVAARGRFTADRVMQEAKQAGPPNDEEVKILSRQHWTEVDRPPTVHVIHAIVMTSDPAQAEAAKALAAEVRKAVVNAADVDEFEQKAKAITHPKNLELKVENLPHSIAADGHTVEGGNMDPAFAKGAFSLANVGDTSTVIQSSFGWHIIRLLERMPEKRIPIETRRAMFAEEVLALRARALLDQRLVPLRASHPVSISPAAAQLMVTAVGTTVAASAVGSAAATP